VTVVLNFLVNHPWISVLLGALIFVGMLEISRRSARAVWFIRKFLHVKASWLGNDLGDEQPDPTTHHVIQPAPALERADTQIAVTPKGKPAPHVPRLEEQPSTEVPPLIEPGVFLYEGVESVYFDKVPRGMVEFGSLEKVSHAVLSQPVVRTLEGEPAFEVLAEIVNCSELRIVGITYRSRGQAAILYVRPGQKHLHLERGPTAWIDRVIVSAGWYSSPTILLLNELIEQIGTDLLVIRHASEDGRADFSSVPGKVVVVICPNDKYSARALRYTADVVIAAAPISERTLVTLKDTHVFDVLPYLLQKGSSEKWPANLLVTRKQNLESSTGRQEVRSALEIIRTANLDITRALAEKRGPNVQFLQKLLGKEPVLDFCDPTLFEGVLQELYNDLLDMCLFAHDSFIVQDERNEDPFDNEFRERLKASLVDAKEIGVEKLEQSADHGLETNTQQSANRGESNSKNDQHHLSY